MSVIYTLDLAKRDFQLGYLTRWRIERAPLEEKGWRLVLGQGMSEGALCDARSKKPRVFKSLDSVVSAIEDIGFKVDVLFRG